MDHSYIHISIGLCKETQQIFPIMIAFTHGLDDDYLAIVQDGNLCIRSCLVPDLSMIQLAPDFVSLAIAEVDGFVHVACLHRACFRLYKAKSSSHELIMDRTLQSLPLSLCASAKGWIVLLSGGVVVSIGESGNTVLVSLGLRNPVRLLHCPSQPERNLGEVILVQSGHHLYTTIDNKISFRMPSNILAVTSLPTATATQSGRTQSGPTLFIVSQRSVVFIADSVVIHARSFPEDAEAAHIFSQGSISEPVRALISFGRQIAVLRGVDLLWTFPRDLTRSAFVSSRRMLIRILEDGSFTQNPLSLSWRQVSGVTRRSRLKDYHSLRNLAEESGLIGSKISSNSNQPAKPQISVYQTVEASEKHREIPNVLNSVDQLAFVTSYILALKDEPIPNKLCHIFETILYKLTDRIPTQ